MTLSPTVTATVASSVFCSGHAPLEHQKPEDQ